MIKKFISKRARPFKAVQWDGTNESEIIDFVGSKNVILVDHEHKILVFKGFKEKSVADIGDFICLCTTPYGKFVNIIKEENFKFRYDVVSNVDDYVKEVREAFR